jgi:hypothetical protein
VPGSILKIEDCNFQPGTRKPRQIYCYAISAKRYALFVRDGNGYPVLLERGVNNDDDKWSEHGLGHLLNPTDPDSEDRKWIKQVWLYIIRKTEGLQVQQPAFANVPAVGRVTVSSPPVMRPFSELNEGKHYSDQIKPFNFVLTCHVNQFGHPTGANPARFHLVLPYDNDPRKWMKREWIDRYSGLRYRIATTGHHGDRRTARVKTYGEVVEEYAFHPESKCADSSGERCGRQSVGLLQRRHVRIGRITYIGKESNSIEDVESGMIQSADDVYTQYIDSRRDEWMTVTLPAIREIQLSVLMKETGMSKRALLDLRAGRSRPHPKNQSLLAAIVHKLADIGEPDLVGQRAYRSA